MPDPTELIDALIASLTDWRGETFANLRRIIRETDHDVAGGSIRCQGIQRTIVQARE